MSRSVNNFRTNVFLTNVYILVISAGNITGISGGNYYLYFRLEILLVFSAVIITGMVGGNYYWYGRREILLVFLGGDTIASWEYFRAAWNV